MASIIKKILKSDDTIDIISNLSIDELEEVITYAADKYYNTDKPVISDAIYDILIDFLKLKDLKSLVLKSVGAKVKSKNKVKLDYHLGSMDKIKPPSNQLDIWKAKYKPPYNLSDKLDGISALLTYKHDGQIKMYTRGTAEEGMDITALVKYLNLPEFEKIQLYCKKNKINGETNLIAFRGELIIKESVFKKKWSKILKNGRNAIGGLVNSKTINPELATDTDLVLYEVVEPFYPIEKQLKIINELEFITVENKTINEPLTYLMLSKYLKERRELSKYQIDGIIVTSCGQHERNVEGNPDYAFAFKDILEDQKAKTIIEEIEWNVSKDGFIKPTILVKPVKIGGVDIKRVTGNNAKFIVDNKLGAGAEIELIRSGDVIPKINKVIKSAKKADLPDMDYEWTQTNVDIILNNHSESKEVLIKNIYYFFSKLETKGLGERNVEKMVDAGLDSILKIIEANKERFLTVESFGEKTANNLVESIKKSLTNISLSKLMAASNKLGHGLGEERMKQILAVYPNLLIDYKKWSKHEFIEKIKTINGWDVKTSTLLVDNFEEFIKFYNSISKHIKLEEPRKSKLIKGQFTDKTLVFTEFRDANLKEKIEAQGGHVASTVSKNTDYLVVNEQSVIDNPTTKVIKALELNIKIITKDKLIKML